MAFQAGQAQGYALGVSGSGSAPSGASVQPASPVPFHPGMMGYHFHPFMGFFGIIPLFIGFDDRIKHFQTSGFRFSASWLLPVWR